MNQSLNLMGLSMVRFALSLWNRNDIQEKLHNLILHGDLTDISGLHDIAKELINLVDTMLFPPLLKPMLQRFILALSNKVLRWKLYAQKIFGDMSFANDIHITSRGILDVSTMITNWLDDCNIDLFIRFKLACEHCFKTKIIELWSELPQHQKIDFLVDYFKLKKTWKRKNKIIYYWVLYLVHRKKIHKTFYKHLLKMALKGDELTLLAAKYFWSLLKKKEQIKCLKIFEKYSSNNTIHFSQLLMERGEINILELGTNWYWYAIFDKLWFYQIAPIFENHMFLVGAFFPNLNKIHYKIKEECGYLTDCNHSQAIKLLRYLWSNAQVLCKAFHLSIYSNEHGYYDGVLMELIRTLFYYGDCETIVLILNDEVINSFQNLKQHLLIHIVLCLYSRNDVFLFCKILQKVLNSAELRAFTDEIPEEEINPYFHSLLIGFLDGLNSQ